MLGFILARYDDLVEKPILMFRIRLCGTVKAGDIVKDNQVLFFPPMSEDEPLFGDVTHQVHYQVVPLFLAITYDLSAATPEISTPKRGCREVTRMVHFTR